MVRDEVAAEAAAEEVSKDIALFVFNKLDPGSVEEKQSGSGIKKITNHFVSNCIVYCDYKHSSIKYTIK